MENTNNKEKNLNELKEKETETIGDVIDRRSKEYVKLYKSLIKDTELKGKAKGLALNDLYQNKFIWESVLERVKKAITKYEGVQE